MLSEAMTDTARVRLGFVLAAVAFVVSALVVAAALVVVWAWTGPLVAGFVGVTALLFSPIYVIWLASVIGPRVYAWRR